MLKSVDSDTENKIPLFDIAGASTVPASFKSLMSSRSTYEISPVLEDEQNRRLDSQRSISDQVTLGEFIYNYRFNESTTSSMVNGSSFSSSSENLLLDFHDFERT